MVAVGALGFSRGDPRILVFGTDYRGDVCGMANDGKNSTGGLDMTDYPAMYWPNPAQIFDAAKVKKFKNPFEGAKTVCVKECPTMNVESVGSLQWVCNYPDGYGPGPSGEEGRLSPAGCGDEGCKDWGIAEWQTAGMDYFDMLTAAQQAEARDQRRMAQDAYGRWRAARMHESPHDCEPHPIVTHEPPSSRTRLSHSERVSGVLYFQYRAISLYITCSRCISYHLINI